MPKFYLSVIIVLLINTLCSAQKYAQATWIGSGTSTSMKIFEIDDQGNAYIVLYGYYDVNFYGTVHTNFPGSGVLGKFNSAGKLLWAKDFAGAIGDQPVSDLKVDADHNIYVCGSARSQTLDDGTVTKKGFLIKMNPNGKTIWGVSADNIAASGFLALSPNGVFWVSAYYSSLSLQGYSLGSNNPNMGSPDSFVAKVDKNGIVTALFHDPARSSVPLAILSTGSGGANAIIMRGTPQNIASVLFDENLNVRSDKLFPAFGITASRFVPTNTGYKWLSYIYSRQNQALGFFDVNLDSDLNIIDSTKIYPSTPSARIIFSAIFDPPHKGYYFTTFPPSSSQAQYDWLFKDTKGNTVTIKDENPKPSLFPDPITRTFAKMNGDTLNMNVRHLNFYTTSFTFDGKSYTTSSNLDATHFWVKYLPEDPDSCIHIHATVVQNGIENSKDAKIKFSLPRSCPATQDLVINLAENQPAANQSDFILPPTAVIKKGDTTAVVNIKVLNDNYMEQLETFSISAKLATNVGGYALGAPYAVTDISIIDDDNIADNRKFKISYIKNVAEGDSGLVTISLLGNTLLSAALPFKLNLSKISYPAFPVVDYKPLNINIPAGSNTVSFKVEALKDNLLEGDEFISGTISADAGVYGTFTASDSLFNVLITDADNIPENKILNIEPGIDSLLEGNFNQYLFSLKNGLKTQYPITINTAKISWANYTNLSDTALVIVTGQSSADLKITYPDDNIIRAAGREALKLNGYNENFGPVKFLFKNKVADTLNINLMDNDKNTAEFKLEPYKLIIKEGHQDSIRLAVAGNKTFEKNVTIKLIWSGVEIATEDRIINKVDSVVLTGGKKSLIIPLSVLNNNHLDKVNERVLTIMPFYDLSKIVVEQQDYVGITIIDDDVSTLSLPNTFSPNNDGINDFWMIPELNYDPASTVQIFNKFGTMVFNSKGYANPWDGTCNGSLLPVGTYYYIIKFHQKSFGGYVTILK